MVYYLVKQATTVSTLGRHNMRAFYFVVLTTMQYVKLIMFNA
jgi:hypothetical protein